jgi:transcription elongation factor Elf1
MSSFFFDDRKYNGPHDCPKCGAPSQWRGTVADTRMIRVVCSSSCGIYEATYSTISDMPFFKES